MKWTTSINDFAHFLKIERGLSNNTISNYIRDIKKLMQYLEDHKISVNPMHIEAELIQQFIYDNAKHLSARSQSRLISGLRSFFDYLIFENYRML